jgi:hypothetical protein
LNVIGDLSASLIEIQAQKKLRQNWKAHDFPHQIIDWEVIQPFNSEIGEDLIAEF